MEWLEWLAPVVGLIFGYFLATWWRKPKPPRLTLTAENAARVEAFQDKERREAAYRIEYNAFCETAPLTGRVTQGPGLRIVNDKP